jgi:hypothetical protein
LHEKLKCVLPRSVVLPNPHMFMSWVLDMLWVLACVGPVQNLHKVTEGIFYYVLSCVYTFYDLMNFVANGK